MNIASPSEDRKHGWEERGRTPVFLTTMTLTQKLFLQVGFEPLPNYRDWTCEMHVWTPVFLLPPPHPKNLSCGWDAKPIKTETMKSNVWTTPLENWGNILKRRVCPECWLLWGWDVTWLTGSVQPGPLGMRMNVQSDALNDENSSTCVGEWTDGDWYSYTVQMIGEVRRPLARLMDWHNSDHSNVQQEERAKCSNECKTNLVTTTECNQRVSTSIFNWYKKWFDTNPTVQLRA